MTKKENKENRKENQTKISLENNRFTLCHVGELVVHLECLYSNDEEFGKEVRNLLTKNGDLEYKSR